MALQSVPVITFHSVRPPELPWLWNHVSCPPDLFEAYLIYLKSHGYTTIFLPELVAYLKGEKSLPDRAVALTFDDGYLDNWTIVAPLLKKYGFCGTAFVTPSFVHPESVIREQLTDPSKQKIAVDQVNGYISWEELKEAENSGIFDVHPHSMTHTWYPSADEIMDFHRPGDRNPWLAWNARPDRKPFWLAEDQSERVPWGTPIYKHEKSLIVRRYFEPEAVTKTLVDYVDQNGGLTFFDKPDWKVYLTKKAVEVQEQGRYETEDNYKARVLHELAASREEILSRLNKNVSIMCWPGGGHNEITIEAARKAGYLSWDVRSIPSYSNIPGRVPEGIARISIPILDVGASSSAINKLIFKYMLEAYRGTFPWKQAQAAIRAINLRSVLLKRHIGKH